MDKSIEAMKLALEVLKKNTKHLPADFDYHFEAITAIKEALVQEQEPVANDPLPRACNRAGVDYQTFLKIKAYMPVAPPQRSESSGKPSAWVGLTKKEILLANEKQDESIIAAPDDELIQFAKAIEAKLKEKNT